MGNIFTPEVRPLSDAKLAQKRKRREADLADPSPAVCFALRRLDVLKRCQARDEHTPTPYHYGLGDNQVPWRRPRIKLGERWGKREEARESV